MNEYDDLLKRRAEGYMREEVTEEYAYSKEDDELILVKKKINRKEVPPDVTAIRLLLSGGVENPFDVFTDEELQQMRTEFLQSTEGEGI